MNERDLFMFKYIKEFKNLTKTADALFISQPTLTARIKQLEYEYDTKLIYSNNKGIFLTATGSVVAKYADEIIRKFEKMKEEVYEVDHAEAGVIKIAAPNIISQYYLPLLIREFKKVYPKVRFKITVAPSSRVSRLMKEGKCDFGFLRDDFGWDGYKILLETNYIAAVSMKPFELHDLERMNRIDYITDTYYQRMLNLWWKETFNKSPKIDIMVNSLDICKAMVFNGLGFGLLPSIFLKESNRAYSYILRGKDGKPILRNTWLVSNERENLDKLLGKFLDFINDMKFSDFLYLGV